MKKVLLASVFLFSALLFAQKDLTTQFTISNDIVGTTDMFKEKSQLVDKMDVYKSGNQLPDYLEKFGYLADNGITSIKLKPESNVLDVVTIATVNRWYKVAPETPMLIDGFEITDKDTKLFVDILKKIEVIQHNNQKTVSVKTK